MHRKSKSSILLPVALAAATGNPSLESAETAANPEITVTNEALDGAVFPVEPGQHYKISFASRTASQGMWAAVFSSAAGDELVSDCYSAIEPSETWRTNEFCVRARHNAATALVRIDATASTIAIHSIRVAPVTDGEAAAWGDSVIKDLPACTVTARPGPVLGRTMETLRAGGKLRVVMLGDSIVNDIVNSNFHTLIQRMYPGIDIDLVAAIRGHTGCPYFRHKNRVKEYVLDHEPDLVIIGGVSHGNDVGAIEDVVRQIRKGSVAEILLLSGAIASEDRHARGHASARAAREGAEEFRRGLARAAKAHELAYFDLRSAWNDFLNKSGKPLGWFQRDGVHGNDRAKQVVGHMLADYFSPATGEE